MLAARTGASKRLLALLQTKVEVELAELAPRRTRVRAGRPLSPYKLDVFSGVWEESNPLEIPEGQQFNLRATWEVLSQPQDSQGKTN